MKTTIHKIFLSLALLFCVTTIQASTEDSLKNVIESTDGDEKLKALVNLTQLKVAEEDAIEYVVLLEEEARKQNDENIIGYALMVKSSIYLNQFNDEKFFPALEEAKVYLKEKKQFDRYFAIYNFEIKKHLNDGFYETAFLKISSMLNEAKESNNINGELNAYENMGDAYYVEKYNQKSIESYQNVLSLLNIHSIERTVYRMFINIRIADIAYKTGDIPLTILYCDSVKQIVEKIDRGEMKDVEHFSTSYIKMLLYIYYALAYISVDKEKEATDALNMAFKYNNEEIEGSTRQAFYYLCSDYYFKKGEVNAALEYIKKNEEMSASNEAHDGDVMRLKAQIFAAMGNFEDAYKVEREYTEQTDSLNQKKLSQRISELRTIHDVEKLEFQAEQERLKSVNLHLFIAGLSIVVLLLAFVILIVLYNLNKIKQKNQVLYKCIQSQEALEVEFKRKEEALRTSLLSDNETSDNEADRLFILLNELMKEEKSYTDPNLSRKTLATKLATNERYLHETIKKHLDLSFTEYLNLLRIDHAREMIIKNLNNISLEDIAIMSGFKTRQTFHRFFRDRYGLSPSEFSGFLKKSSNLVH
jgi:Transcriptional regulator containing an amidase domain and an AraC-type DNA-binding HTH domain